MEEAAPRNENLNFAANRRYMYYQDTDVIYFSVIRFRFSILINTINRRAIPPGNAHGYTAFLPAYFVFIIHRIVILYKTERLSNTQAGRYGKQEESVCFSI